MSAARISTLLCASFALATNAAAQEGESFVTQLRLPARGTAIEVFAWRGPNGIEVEGSALARLGIAVPDNTDHIVLAHVPGLRFQEATDQGAIIITCESQCFAPQNIDLEGDEVEEDEEQVITSSAGAYLNYEADLQWVEDSGVSASGIAEAAVFGRWGLLESSWIAQTGGETSGFTRLESRWTIDDPRHNIRTRLGDSVMLSASGSPVRFGGLQIGRYFELTPSLVTYPTPAIAGDVESASTVQLYVDGVLRAQGEVEAGPFTIDQAPVVSGAGEAEIVITDLLGRQQTITRPFFVSTTMLRPGLSDWSLSIGAERRGFGRDDNRYGDTFAAVRYRQGLTNWLTLEGGAEATAEVTTAQIGAMITSTRFGQAYVSRAANEDGGFTTASWYYDGRAMWVGAQWEQRDGDFVPLGQGSDDDFKQGLSANFAIEMGEFGSAAFTAAEVQFIDEPQIRTYTLSYSPDFADGAVSFRIVRTESDNSDLVAGVSFSFPLGGDVSGHFSADHNSHGMTYRASAHRAVEPDHLGWRARATAGATERFEGAVMARSALGDSVAEAGVSNGVYGARVRHTGSVGWIEGIPFAGRNIDGGFALVDAGASNVSIARNRLDIGESGRDGRRLVTNLRPYGDNLISISPDDLPIDRAPENPVRHVRPPEGAGVVVRFSDAQERLIETRVHFEGGAAPPRGAILVRRRDGERFPIGSDGRLVLQGAQDGDVLQLEDSTCSARADERAADSGLNLVCAVMS